MPANSNVLSVSSHIKGFWVAAFKILLAACCKLEHPAWQQKDRVRETELRRHPQGPRPHRPPARGHRSRQPRAGANGRSRRSKGPQRRFRPRTGPAHPTTARFRAVRRAGKVIEALKSNAWDVAFMAIEPVRAAKLEFTEPYAIVEGTYMVTRDSPLTAIAYFDKPGIRIAPGRDSVHHLYLQRIIKQATLLPARTGGDALERSGQEAAVAPL